MVFSATIVNAPRAFNLENPLMMHLTTIIYLSFNLSLLWHYLYLLFLCSIIAAASPNISLESCNFCDSPIVLLSFLTPDNGAEAGISKEPWINPVYQGLTKILMSVYSGLVAIIADRLSCLVICVFAVCLLLASYRTFNMVDTKTPEANCFT